RIKPVLRDERHRQTEASEEARPERPQVERRGRILEHVRCRHKQRRWLTIEALEHPEERPRLEPVESAIVEGVTMRPQPEALRVVPLPRHDEMPNIVPRDRARGP